MATKKKTRRGGEPMASLPASEAPPIPILSRIDPPHPVGEVVSEAPAAPPAPLTIEAAPVPDDAVAAATGRSAPHLTEQLQTQAMQLGSLLRAKQIELDRREALMNAREAKLENELRMGRLWTRERDEDVRVREHDFNARVKAIEEKAAQLAAMELSADRDVSTQQVQLALQQQACAARESQIAAAEARLLAEREAIDAARTRLEQQRVEESTAHLAIQQRLALQQAQAQEQLRLQLKNIEEARDAIEQQEQALLRKEQELTGARDREAWEGRLAARETELQQAETLLAMHAREIDEHRGALLAEREKLAQQARDERREIAEWQQRQRAELAERKKQLDLSEEALDKHRAAVEQLRDDVARKHREALELRLVTEQLWLELTRHVPAAELTRSLTTLRQRLAEHYRETEEKQATQHAELVRLAARLDEQQRRLVEQREQLRQWLAAQQQDIESQAARLVAREQQLDQQERVAQQQEERWHKERRELRHRISELLGKLRQQDVACA